MRLGFQRGLYARWRRQDTRRAHSEGRGTMAQSEDARCRPTRGWKLRRRGGLRAREMRCCFKIQDHKDSTLGETRLAHASGTTWGGGLRRVGANEPTVALGSPFLPPPPPPARLLRQTNNRRRRVTHRGLDRHVEHLLGAALCPADLVRLAQLEALRFDPEFKFGVVRGARLAAVEWTIRSYFLRVTVLVLPESP